MARWFLSLLICLLPLSLAAQDRATLVADSLRIDSNAVLVAEGNVEIFYQGQRLTAQKLVYNRAGEVLTITGPIRLEDGRGNVFLADMAELDADLKEGIMTSARLVLEDQLQLAAAAIIRSDGGRLTELRQVAASSCTICPGSTVPLWEIRAKSVIHDADQQRLFFDQAQLRLYGVPVFYIPRLRLPDTGVARTSGFLVPRLRTTSAAGTGLKLPYFVTLGRSADVTFTPYITNRNGRTLELRFRQVLRDGSIEVNSAFTQDRLLPGQDRGYAAYQGSIGLPQDFTLTFDGIVVSDPAYLFDYGISNADRLASQIEIARTRKNEHIAGQTIGFQTLREGEAASTIPSLVGDFTFHRRFGPDVLGGEGGIQIQTHSHQRTSTSPLDGDGDGIADGRDLDRVSAQLDWRRNWILTNGMKLALQSQVNVDYYAITQDATYAGSQALLYGLAAAEWRWPWLRTGAAGGSEVLEPVVQLVFAPGLRDGVPNEDSTLVEFDEGNLFALNRFPGADAVEAESRANLGLSYLRTDAAGWSLGGVVGRVVRRADAGQFGVASGLDGLMSDWLIAGQYKGTDGALVTGRLLLDDSLALTKGALRLGVERDRYGLFTGYEYVLPDPVENRPDLTSELVLNARYDLSRNWSTSLESRYDFNAGRSSQADLGLAFRNECIDVNLSLSRRFTSSTSVQPTSVFGLSVELLGFGGGSRGPSRVCRK